MKFFPKILTFLSLLGCKTAALPEFYELMTPTAPLQQRASQALERVTDFGPNKSNTKMYIYVPKKLADPLPIIVAIHYCHGTASSYYSGAPYPRLADQRGFIVIYPESPYSDGCWDISSRGALTHDGGGDSNSIANMVNYTLNKYSGDPTKVYVLGVSSGAMMTVSALPPSLSCGLRANVIFLLSFRTSWRQRIQSCSRPASSILASRQAASIANLAARASGIVRVRKGRFTTLRSNGHRYEIYNPSNNPSRSARHRGWEMTA